MSVIKNVMLSACLASSLSLVSCSPSTHLGNRNFSHSRSREPQFLDDISLEGGGHSKISTASAEGDRKNNHSPINGKALQAKYADMLGVPQQTISNIPLYGFIEDWYGVRYCMGGSDKSGIDCSGFVQQLYEQVFGTDLLRTATEQFTNCSFVRETEELHEGDLVFFKIHSKRITHVGVYLANNYFVHASTSKGVMISSLNEPYWSRYFAGAGYVPKGRG